MPEFRVMTPDAKGTRTCTPCDSAKLAKPVRSAPLTPLKKSREKSHAAFASALKRHRCEQPLRMDSPPTGWVTALAGLLACGSLHTVRPSRFPSDTLWTISSPLTVAGAATASTEGRLRVPSCLSGATRRTSAKTMILPRTGRVKRSRRCERTARERHNQCVCCVG